MKDLKGKTGFVTGAASGFGLALASALLRQGMKVVLADIQGGALRKAANQLGSLGQLATVECDVTQRESMHAAARYVRDTFGQLHVLCNNAGVLAPGSLESGSAQDWHWSFSVNVMGIVHGIEAFMPHMRAHGEEGHVVNTASMAGLRGLAKASPYCATKAAAISISESLAAELAGTRIGVTVLCPGFMRTSLYDHGLQRPDRFGGEKQTLLDAEAEDHLRDSIAGGFSPEAVADRTVRAIKSGEFYVITHPQHRADIAAKSEQLLVAYDRAGIERVG
jgi:NAD(P)-dependent dehydrogenase (short-subunit alcohol dehydrogenase family)